MKASRSQRCNGTLGTYGKGYNEQALWEIRTWETPAEIGPSARRRGSYKDVLVKKKSSIMNPCAKRGKIWVSKLQSKVVSIKVELVQINVSILFQFVR